MPMGPGPATSSMGRKFHVVPDQKNDLDLPKREKKIPVSLADV